jgi:phosphoribosylaminoimidazolecarboxamide formyltransferase/IMP cyclohydrolase
MATSQTKAYEKAFACDSTSAFGGIVALNTPLTKQAAKKMTGQQFIEVIIAPSIDADALDVLALKKNLRVLSTPLNKNAAEKSYHSISGGVLIQEADTRVITKEDLTVATERAPSDQEIEDCLFAWQVVKYVKSNAIVYAKDGATLGIGTGQTSRVFSAEIAALKARQAGLNLKGAALASDAFFPFADGLEIAINAGITAIIQPGGSIRDNEVIDAANRAGITMLFTGTRHFRH